MRINPALSLFLAASAAHAGPSGVPADFVHPDDHASCVTCARMMSLAERRVPAGETFPAVPFAPREAFDATDVLHYDLEFEIFPGSEEIEGTNTITVRALADGLSQFTFRLRSNYTVTSASVDGTPISVTSIDTVSRRANLGRTFAAGETFDLTIAYEGPALSRGFGSIEFGSTGGQPIVASLSEPYYAYTWWPSKDGEFGVPGDNSDKATADVAIIAPASMRSVANGSFEGVDTLSGGRSRYRWSTDYPTSTYLFAFSSHPYNTWTRTFDYTDGTGTYSMPVEFNIYPSQDNPSNRAGWERSIDMLEVFSDLFGVYPFINEKYGIYQFPFGGGMEHQTNSGQTSFGASLTAHELGHQWWGDMITCADWTEIWLNEGFATYCEALWEEFKTGTSNKAALRSAMLSREPTGTDAYQPLVLSSGETSDLYRIFGSTSYLKGGWALHMLRWILGDQGFFDSLRAYRAAHEGGVATTEDLADAILAATGTDVSGFFDDFAYGYGVPSYRYDWAPTTIEGQPYAHVVLRQVQNSSWSTFELPVEARFTGNQSFRLYQTSRTAQYYLVPLASAASSMSLDPDDWLLAGFSSSGISLGTSIPPKVIDASFDDGQAFADAPTSLAVTFSDDIDADASDVVLTDGTGAFAVSVGVSGNELTITPAAPLPAGDYTLTLRDSITAGGIALDGEFPGVQLESLNLPTGDGLAGGDTVLAFTIEAPDCVADLSGDDNLNNTDINLFVQAFLAQDPAADINTDGNWNNTDINAFVQAFLAGCG